MGQLCTYYIHAMIISPTPLELRARHNDMRALVALLLTLTAF